MIKNIIFAGGGTKGHAYIGTIKALYEYPFKDIEQIIGVSIGSVFGLLYLLQIPIDVILDFAINLDYNEIIDISLDDILINQSLLIGKQYISKVKEIISYRIDPDITFIQLKMYSKILLTFNALNISTSKLDYFNYILTPDVKVIDAIQASSNVPLLFPPYSLSAPTPP